MTCIPSNIQDKFAWQVNIHYALPYFHIKTKLIATKKYSSFASAAQDQMTPFCCQLQKTHRCSQGSFTALGNWFIYHYVACMTWLYLLATCTTLFVTAFCCTLVPQLVHIWCLFSYIDILLFLKNNCIVFILTLQQCQFYQLITKNVQVKEVVVHTPKNDTVVYLCHARTVTLKHVPAITQQ
jgi:hypothetical protein